MPSLPAIYYVMVVIAIISVLLTISFFLITILMKIPKSTTYSFLLNLIIIAAIHSLGYTLNWVDYKAGEKRTLFFNDTLCTIQSVVNIFTLFSLEFWITTILLWFCIHIRRTESIDSYGRDTKDLMLDEDELSPQVEQKEISTLGLIGCYGLGYGIPIILLIIYSCAGIFGMGTVFCWIDSINKPGENWKLTIYVIKWINIGISFILSIIIGISEKKEEKRQSKCCLCFKSKNSKLLLIPLIQFIGACPPTIYRIMYNIDPKSSSLPILRHIDVISMSIQGVLYPIIVGYIGGIYTVLLKYKFRNDSLSKIVQMIETE